MSKIRYIDTNKPRKTLSSVTFKEDTVYPAHTEKSEGRIPYVPKSHYDKLIDLIKESDQKDKLETLAKL